MTLAELEAKVEEAKRLFDEARRARVDAEVAADQAWWAYMAAVRAYEQAIKERDDDAR